tara:strand:+ start:152 stop:889 length:738 start_codon:yes stop_codon:yes gene_type:complete
MIYINKILPIIVSPLGLIIFLLIVGILKKKILSVLMALTLLIVFSLPIVSTYLIKLLEQDYKPIAPRDIPVADTVVVLSGMLRAIEGNDGFKYEFTDSVDRIIAGMQILNLNKAKKIILTQGKLPWSVGISEGKHLADFIQSQGIEIDKIRLTQIVQNTHDEAIAVSNMLPKNSEIILVTSAFHMPRAKKVFQNQSLNVIPYAVDFRQSAKKMDVLDFLPRAKAFNESSLFFKELIGRAYYAFRF